MKEVQLGIYALPYTYVTDRNILDTLIYPNMYKNYYWSDDFSPQYYIAQAKAGFIAVTDFYEEQELLLPEIQFAYALLDFKNLHQSTKVQKLLQSKTLKLEFSHDLTEIGDLINHYHKNCWLTPAYLLMLKATQDHDTNFQMLAVGIRENGKIVAGELGYIIGKTYTSLSGFSSKEKQYNHYGSAQLVLLAQHLEKKGFAFWNLGQPYMTYKQTLGVTILERKLFLKRWFQASEELLLAI